MWFIYSKSDLNGDSSVLTRFLIMFSTWTFSQKRLHISIAIFLGKSVSDTFFY